MDKGVADIVKDHKRKHDDDEDNDDEDPPARPNQGKKTKRRRTKESESSKKPSSTKETTKGKTLTKGSKTGKSDLAKEPVKEPIAEVIMDDAGDDVAHDDNPPQDTSEPKTRKTLNLEWFKQPPRTPTPDPEWNKRQYMLNGLKIKNLTQDILLVPAFNLLKGTCSSSIELEYNFQECFNALTDKLDWNNPEGDRYPFDLSKPLHLQGPLGHRTIAADYFFNNDLEYLKTSDLEVTYTTSITKTKAALTGVKDANCGIDLRRDCGERSDQQLYKFKECDFVDLHLNDIEDMLLLVVQHKLFHLDGNVIVGFIMALRMFTRSLIIKRRVEDLQLGVESYQKKLNITKPQKTFLEIEFKEPYTPSYDLPRIIYEDLNKHKRVLRADEVYKFSDGTLKSVRDEIHHRVLDFCLDYNTKMPKRKWTAVDRKRSGLMIELINKQKVNSHEVAPFTRWENYGHGPYANTETKRAYNPYLHINRIFGSNYGADNAGYTQDNQEHKKEHHDPSTCRVKRFEMTKYSFDAEDEMQYGDLAVKKSTIWYNLKKTCVELLLLAKKDSDGQVLIAEDYAWVEVSNSDSKVRMEANMVYMEKMKKVLSDSDYSSSSDNDTLQEVPCYSSDFENEYDATTSDYYDKSELNYGLFVDNNDDHELFHDAIELAQEIFDENHIASQNDHNESESNYNEFEDKDHIIDTNDC
ncbi:hypothetical protein Tco_1214855 [Tanacetum coccineum]